ncbi:hypothetical protein O1D97_02175 [Marinomonas sp. 15G1-11]|uniref:Transposase n=1 Tax=Marinomonas phaeophyticola TaxID=3004091 RepID=A0ABT4JRN6_9GAMM|nr:hypothetical protein [Marinomonas sp. 15G1-11]MCZ2720483.1 hypothetical protein [Marinomonas sp. 15G1-11]
MNNIGIDISKHKLDCLWLKDPQLNKVKTKVFKNTTDEHQRLGRWLLDQIQALGAAMRKLVQICFGVINHQNEYYPLLKN